MFNAVPLSAKSEKTSHQSTWRWLGMILLFFICTSAFSQNTKGDKPLRPLPRITQKSKPQKGRKVRSDTRDISGRRLRTKNKSTAARAVISASSPYQGRVSRGGDRPAKPIRGVSTRIRSSSAQLARNNVYPNKGPYINNPSRKPRKSERSFSNAGPIGNPGLLGRSKAASIPRKSRVAPISASRSFLSRGKKNVYWGKFSKGEKAYTKDITGRPLRTKNFRTPPIGLISQGDPYNGRKRVGDKSSRSSGQSALSISSNGRAWKGDISGRPIRKNSSKSRIEKAGEFFFPRKLSTSGQRRPNKPLVGSGLTKSNRKGRSNSPLPASMPAGADVGSFQGFSKQTKGFGEQGAGFSGDFKGKRPLKGGGSVSGLSRSNKNRPLPSRIPIGGAGVGAYRGNVKRNQLLGFGDQGIGFSGNIKSRRPLKGGGSITGQLRNNRDQPIPAKIPLSGGNIGRYSGNIKGSRVRDYADQGAGFSGFIKRFRPEKGGGSISGRARNNNGNPMSVRTGDPATRSAALYSGTFKSRRPEKGGGSISGRARNNNGNPMSVRTGDPATRSAALYSGTFKSRRPEKGGGSISGRSRNNGGNALVGRLPSGGTVKAANYKGRILASEIHAFEDQGEGFTGFKKAKKPVKGGGSISGKIWNNGEKPIPVRTPLASDAKAANYRGKIKNRTNYIQNKLAAEASLKKREPENNAFRTEGLQIKVKRGKYDQNSSAAKTSLEKRVPQKDAYAVDGLQIRVKQGRYDQNSSSAKTSLEKRVPQKEAFAVEGLQIRVPQGRYKKNSKANENALKGIAPNAATVRASEYMGRMKMVWDYRRNPSSKSSLAVVRPTHTFTKGNEHQGRIRLTKNYSHNPKGSKEALKVIAPGKAYAKIGNYQGNLKMNKPHGSNLHPDAKFAHGHLKNVKQERTILTNAKLWWSKLFKKNDTQPSAVKEKVRRPRYDKKERELWKDLYD